PEQSPAPGSVASPLVPIAVRGTRIAATPPHTADTTTLPLLDALPIYLRMMRGYLDTGAQHPSTIGVSGLPASATGYDIYVYIDGDNGCATRAGTYAVSGSGVTTTSIAATDAPNTDFSGTFVQAANSAG